MYLTKYVEPLITSSSKSDIDPWHHILMFCLLILLIGDSQPITHYSCDKFYNVCDFVMNLLLFHEMSSHIDLF